MTRKRLISASVATLLALALTALPVAPDLAEGDLAGAAAYAKGPGGGDGGGNGGGHGGGKGGHGHGQGHSKAHGKGHSKARGFGHAFEQGHVIGLGHGHVPGLGRDRELGRGHGHGHGDGPVRNADAVSGIALVPDTTASKEKPATEQNPTASSRGRPSAGHAGESAGGSDQAIADIAAALARAADKTGDHSVAGVAVAARAGGTTKRPSGVQNGSDASGDE